MDCAYNLCQKLLNTKYTKQEFCYFDLCMYMPHMPHVHTHHYC